MDSPPLWVRTGARLRVQTANPDTTSVARVLLHAAYKKLGRELPQVRAAVDFSASCRPSRIQPQRKGDDSANNGMDVQHELTCDARSRTPELHSRVPCVSTELSVARLRGGRIAISG